MTGITRDEYEEELERLDYELRHINIFTHDTLACTHLEQLAEVKRQLENAYMRNNKTVWCPVDNLTCPYYNCGRCGIKDPIKDCKDFTDYYDSWEEWEKKD